jgi:uncharacterized linocin/CFP29 family protein
MDVLRRDSAPFSGRVWQQIDATVAAVKQGNCTARRFLEVDGPYGLGLTSLSRDDSWLEPQTTGATPDDWGVRRAYVAPDAPPGSDPDERISGRGTYLVQASASPVPLIVSEFLLSIRNVEAFDDECQPLDLSRAVRAARDVALEEERLIYYGNVQGSPFGLLTLNFEQQYLQQVLQQLLPADRAAIRAAIRAAMGTDELFQQVFDPAPQPILQPDFLLVRQTILGQIGEAALHGIDGNLNLSVSRFPEPPPPVGHVVQALALAVARLAQRGFPGPYVLAMTPDVNTYFIQIVQDTEALLIELLQKVFVIGIHVVPAIQRNVAQGPGLPPGVIGMIMSCGRQNARLVVGQDWTVGYAGRKGVYHRFLIMSSLRLEISEPRAIQVLRLGD